MLAAYWVAMGEVLHRRNDCPGSARESARLPFQFRLWVLLAVTAGIAIHFGIGRWDVGAATLSATWFSGAIAMAAAKRRRWPHVLAALCGVAASALTCALIIGAVTSASAFSQSPDDTVWALGGGWSAVIMMAVMGLAVGTFVGLVLAAVYGLCVLGEMRNAKSARRSQDAERE